MRRNPSGGRSPLSTVKDMLVIGGIAIPSLLAAGVVLPAILPDSVTSRPALNATIVGGIGLAAGITGAMLGFPRLGIGIGLPLVAVASYSALAIIMAPAPQAQAPQVAAPNLGAVVLNQRRIAAVVPRQMAAVVPRGMGAVIPGRAMGATFPLPRAPALTVPGRVWRSTNTRSMGAVEAMVGDAALRGSYPVRGQPSVSSRLGI